MAKGNWRATKRHIGEFLKSGLHPGRAAGSGVAYDSYAENSWPDGKVRPTKRFKKRGRGFPEIWGHKPEEDAPVVTYRMSKKELREYFFGKEEAGE